MKKDKKVCILSKPDDREYGAKIIAYLESLGGHNLSLLMGYATSDPYYYYVDSENSFIKHNYAEIPDGYKVISLDNCPVKENKLVGIRVTKTANGRDIIKYLKTLGGKNKDFSGNSSIGDYYYMGSDFIIKCNNKLPSTHTEIFLPIKSNTIKNELDLTKILKVGDIIWSAAIGECIVDRVYRGENNNILYPITIKHINPIFNPHSTLLQYDKSGKLYNRDNASECILFPSKTQRDWSKFIRCPFQKGELIAISNTENPTIRDLDFGYFLEMDFEYIKCSQTTKSLSHISSKYAWKLSEIEIILNKEAKQ